MVNNKLSRSLLLCTEKRIELRRAFFECTSKVRFLYNNIINGNLEGEWGLENKLLSLTVDGETLGLKLSHGWDWENNRYTLIYTGLDEEGLTIWGKKNDEGWPPVYCTAGIICL